MLPVLESGSTACLAGGRADNFMPEAYPLPARQPRPAGRNGAPVDSLDRFRVQRTAVVILVTFVKGPANAEQAAALRTATALDLGLAHLTILLARLLLDRGLV